MDPISSRINQPSDADPLSSPVSYLLDRSDDEQKRLYFQHQMMRLILGTNIVAPLPHPPHTVLDVGCGTGQWALEVAYEYPTAQVMGVDITMPKVNTQHPHFPKNCRFARHNLLDALPYAPQSFEYIHLRFMATSLPKAQWAEVFAGLAALLQPGGWLEWVDTGDVVDAGPGYTEFQAAWAELGKRTGHISRPGAFIADALRPHFPVVELKHFQAPVGEWGGVIGGLAGQDGVAIFHAMRANILRLGIMSPEDWERCMQQMHAETGTPNSPYHGIWSAFAACGQSPE